MEQPKPRERRRPTLLQQMYDGPSHAEQTDARLARQRNARLARAKPRAI